MSLNHKDYSRKRFGKLTVISNIEPSMGEKNKGGVWLCQCDCGNTIEVNAYRLHGRKSCGCASEQASLKRGSSMRNYDTVTINSEYCCHKSNSKSRGMIPLERDAWWNIVQQPCFYCGETDIRNRAVHQTYQKQRGKSLIEGEVDLYAVHINGVDRKDSSRGYEEDNVVACCAMCNRIKNHFCMNEFMQKIKQICAKHP